MKVPAKQIAAYFALNHKQLDQPAQARARHILVADSATAQKVEADLKAGKSQAIALANARDLLDDYIEFKLPYLSDDVIVERFQRIGNTLKYDVTVDDPYFVKPFVMPTRTLIAAKSGQHAQEDYPCIERSLDHMISGEKH